MAMRPSDPIPGCPSPSRWLSVTSTRTLMYLFKARKVKRQVGYPLVTYKKLWKITIFSGKTHYKWSFSIAMLNYQRVLFDTCWWISQNLDQSFSGIAKTQRRNMTSLYLWLCTVATSKHFHICYMFMYFHIFSYPYHHILALLSTNRAQSEVEKRLCASNYQRFATPHRWSAGTACSHFAASAEN